MRGGNTYEFHQPVRPDDVITATWEIADIDRADHRQRRATCSSSPRRATYTNQHGELLAENEETLIFVGLERCA